MVSGEEWLEQPRSNRVRRAELFTELDRLRGAVGGGYYQVPLPSGALRTFHIEKKRATNRAGSPVVLTFIYMQHDNRTVDVKPPEAQIYVLRAILEAGEKLGI